MEHLSKHLENGDPYKALKAYLSSGRKYIPKQPIIFIDDSDIVKPNDYKFEALGLVRDGSKSTADKSIFAKGYHVTEACALAENAHPISIFSEIHSSKEKSFTSVNDITFRAMKRGAALFGKATFVMDRGYDDNKMFLKPHDLKQDYVIRLTAKRKLFFHGKWTPATQLRNQRKGKIKTVISYMGKKHETYLSHVKVQITGSRKSIYLVLVYGITEHPMMLATNKAIRPKDDVVAVAKLYFSGWRIEEYFRCKKQVFRFKSFRVRKLKAINALNFYITLCMAFLAHISMKSETNTIKVFIIETAAPIKEKVHFCYYRLAKGILGILGLARESVGL